MALVRFKFKQDLREGDPGSRIQKVWAYVDTFDSRDPVTGACVNPQRVSLLNAQGQVRPAVATKLNALAAWVLANHGKTITWEIESLPSGAGPYIVLDVYELNVTSLRPIRKALNRLLESYNATHTPELDADGELLVR